LRLLALAAVSAAAIAGVDASAFRYTRTVPDEVAAGRVAFEPDGLLLAHSRPGLADLRIVDAEGGPVPWRRVPQEIVGPGPAVLLNSGRRGDQAVALIDVGPRRRFYERAELDIAGGDFVGRVTVLGADRRAGPYTRLSTTTVFDVEGATSARSTTVVFPPTDFRFLELRATGVSRIEGATVFAQFERPRLVRRRHAVLAGVRERGRASVYTLDLGVRRIPVTRLEIRADRTPRYDRPVRVEGTNDRRRFAWLGDGRMTRAPGISSQTIELQSRFRYLRVTIENGDDPPLEFVRTETYGPSFAVMVEAGHPAPLRLYYGADEVVAPSYEFARLPAERPVEILDPSRLAPERPNPAFELPGPTFGERNRWIVSAALLAAALVVAAAGVLAFRRRA
jgi:hypothetical protein